MVQIQFHDKVGNSESLTGLQGQTVDELLRTHNIPVNAVLTRINGKLVSEGSVLIHEADEVEVRQVRHYDMDVIRKPLNTQVGSSQPVYTKSVLFDNDGDLEVCSERFDESGFINYIEQVFIHSILDNGLFSSDSGAVVGLSGGRDSVAFLKLLERTKKNLPPLNFKAVTVTGLPDWEEPMTFGAAKMSCKALGAEHIIVDSGSIDEVFNLSRPFIEVMKRIAASKRHNIVMVITHHIMRRMIEIEAEKANISTVVLGLNSDDLVASLITWFTSGFQMGSIPKRRIGHFNYVFPLYRITKKELTLYLELVAPELNRQGSPGKFTTGPEERSLAYAITDHLYDLWPGIDYYLFKAFENMQEFMIPRQHEKCANCGASILKLSHKENVNVLCDVCDEFNHHKMLMQR